MRRLEEVEGISSWYTLTCSPSHSLRPSSQSRHTSDSPAPLAPSQAYSSVGKVPTVLKTAFIIAM
jgi:hypothetical protein